MTSPGGREVGRVSVRVVPDTSKFREELRKELAKLQDIEIDVVPNVEKFREELKKQVRDATDGTKVTIPVELDQNQVERAAQGLRQALTNANMPNFLNDMSRLDIVMRRVVVNAEQIRTNLVNASRSVVDFTRSALNVRSHFEGISKTAQNIRGHIGLIRFDTMQAGVQRVTDSIRRIPGYIGLIRFGPIETGLQRSNNAVNSFGNRSRSVFGSIGTIVGTVAKAIRSFTSTIATGLGSALSNIGQMLPRLIGSGLQSFGDSLTKLGEAVDDVGKKGSSTAKSIASAFFAAAQAAVAVTGAILQLGGISALLVVAGAAITAAWGLASGVIAAIPSALFAIAGPIAAVVLGFDGIKKAAETLRPEFDKLRQSVSDTFERGMTPVFERLGRVFPTLTTGLNDISESVISVGSNLADVVIASDKLGLLQPIFDNITRSVESMNPGISSILRSFILLGNQTSVFNLLTSAVNTFGQAWETAVRQSIADGTFDAAISGLSTLIDILTRSIVGLVTNGLRVLAASAPGINEFFRSLSEFFGGFNWERLGTAVGRVFDGLAAAIRNVDPAAIQRIEDAFVRLGDVFQDPSFQQQLGNIVEIIPEVIDALGSLTRAFASTASGVAGAFQVASGTISWFDSTFAGDWFGADQAAQRAVEGWRKIGDAFTTGGDETATATTEAGQKARDALQQSFGELPPVVQEELAKLSPAAQQALEGVNPAIQQGLVDVPTTIQTILEGLSPVVEGAFNSLVSHAEVGVGVIAEGIRRRANMIDLAFRDLFANAGVEVDTAMTTINTSVSEGLTLLNDLFSAGQQGVAEFGQSLLTLGTNSTTLGVQLVTLNTNITTLSTSFSTVNTGLLTLNTSLTALNVTATTLNATLTTIIASFVTLGTNLVTINTNVTTLITSVTDVNTIMTTLTTTLVLLGTQISMLNLSLPMLIKSLQTLNIALTTLNTSLPVLTENFTLLLNAINLVLPALQTLVTAIDALIVALANLSTAFTTLQTTVTTAMTAIVLSVTEGLVQVNTAWAEAIALWVELITSGMAAIVEAIATGMGDAVNSVQTGIDLMVSALQAAEKDFYDAGANMGQALADGLNSKAGAVEAAARRLANAAAAAVRAAAGIASPSKVFTQLGEYMGDGIPIGLKNTTQAVRMAATKLVGAAVKATQGLQDAFTLDGWSDNIRTEVPTAVSELRSVSTGTWTDEVSAGDFGGLTDAVETALSGWNVQIDGNGMAKLVNKSNTRKNRRR